jgi:DNA invertase Pin-like site-specific DNA recombinase
MPAAIRAAIYVRISRDREGAGLGVGRQRDDCQELAGRLGWTVADVYSDNDTSAYSGKPRPAYVRMMADIESGKVNAILAWHTDRLHRSPIELERFIEIVESRHVQIRTVKAGELDLATSSGRMVARVLGATARHESEHKSERIRRKALELAKAGKPITGGTRPFGYEDDHVTIRESEAVVIRDLMKRALAGQSFGSLVRDLNDRAIRTPGGGLWRTTTLQRVLCSARIAGWRSHNVGNVKPRLGVPFVAKGTWPAIVSRADVERLRELLSEPRKRQPPRSYLLSGILECNRCHHPMLGSASGYNNARRYMCVPKPEGQGCGRTFVRADDVEAELRDQVRAAMGDGLLERLARAEHESESDQELAAGITDDEASLAQLGRDLDDKIITRAEWLERRQRLQDRIDGARARLAAIQAPADDLSRFTGGAEAFDRAWNDDSITDSALFERRRGLFRTVFQRVVVLPAVIKGLNRFDPDRLVPVWRA